MKIICCVVSATLAYLAGAATLGASTIQLGSAPANLIICDNCGTSDGVSHPGAVTPPGPGYPTPVNGPDESFGGNGPGSNGYISTTIDMTQVFADPNLGVSMWDVDNGMVYANYSFFEQTTDQPEVVSQGSISLTFFDANITQIGQDTSNWVHSYGQWGSDGGSFLVPSLTRYIVFTDNFSSSHLHDANDVFIDGNYLGLVGAPEPNMLIPMLGLACALLFIGRLRRFVR